MSCRTAFGQGSEHMYVRKFPFFTSTNYQSIYNPIRRRMALNNRDVTILLPYVTETTHSVGYVVVLIHFRFLSYLGFGAGLKPVTGHCRLATAAL